ncbi:DUF4374 domain-containing protein [Ihuprevotella massiliensis]|uniref:DUF4374 domain-containing protein n=1 Tax=Ihuprevotella massiliensis TaxID=1852368 RepID=UPI00094EFAA8
MRNNFLSWFDVAKAGLFLSLFGAAIAFVSCSSGDGPISPNKGGTTSSEGDARNGKGAYFIAVKSDNGTEYIMQTNSLTAGDLDIRNNVMELPQTEYTWIFDRHNAVGMVYQQQFSGLGYGLRWTSDDGPFAKLGEFRIDTRFSNYGFFNGQLVTSVGGQVSADGKRNDGATFVFWNITSEGVKLDHTKTIWTEPITGNGQQVTFSSIVDNGDGTFLTAMVQSAFHQTGTGDGSSVGEVKYPDSVWVAKMDKELNVLKVYRDNRISYAAGHYRSQVLHEVFKTQDGTVYVFSNGFNAATTRKAGALRIHKGADEFDQDYYFDIQTPTDGYKFRRVWYITGSKFLLELYNERKINTLSAGHQFAMVDMESKKFTWLSGLPAKNLITSGAETGGVPMYADGVVYLPITQFGQDAAIYLVNPETGVATKGITIRGVREIRTLGKLN